MNDTATAGADDLASLVIDGPEEITAPWLEAALAASGRTASVDDVRVEAVGTGQMGASYRVTFAVDDGTQRSTETLVAKLAAGSAESRETVAPGYRSEITFYRHVAGSLAGRIPACHLAVASDDWQRFTLLLEDLTPAVQGDQLAGADRPAVLLSAVNLAGLHGPRWSDPALFDIPYVARVGQGDAEFLAAVFDDAVVTFLERFGGDLEAADVAVLREVSAVLPPFLLSRPDRFSVLHGDYRLDNLLFHPDGTSVAAVDWQTMTVGLPGRDLAYLVGTSMDPKAREADEEEIVAAYHEALVGHAAAADVDAATCFEDYRVGMLQCPLITVLGAAYGSRTDRGDAMFTVMAQRSLAALRHLGTIDAV